MTYTSVQEVLDFYKETTFYPYGFVEALKDVEDKLLNRIKELENDIIQRDASEGN